VNRIIQGIKVSKILQDYAKEIDLLFEGDLEVYKRLVDVILNTEENIIVKLALIEQLSNL